jgi:hypothetical protein
MAGESNGINNQQSQIVCSDEASFGSLLGLMGSRSGRDRREQVTRALQTPNVMNQVQFPREFFHQVLEIKAMGINKDNTIPTLIIGIESPGYTAAMFSDDVKRVKEFLGYQNPDDERNIYRVLLKPVRDNQDQILDRILNSDDATNQMLSIIEHLRHTGKLGETVMTHKSNARVDNAGTVPNDGRPITLQSSTEHSALTRGVSDIRVVSVSVTSSDFIFDALNYLLEQWHDNIRDEQSARNIYFITNSELPGNAFLKFWKDKCILNKCSSVQYVNLKEYLSFGYYNPGVNKSDKKQQESP